MSDSSYVNEGPNDLFQFDGDKINEEVIIQKMNQLTVGKRLAERAEEVKKETLQSLIQKTISLLEKHTERGKRNCQIIMIITPAECCFLGDESNHSKNYYWYESELAKQNITCDLVEGSDCDCQTNLEKEDNCHIEMQFSW